MIKKQQRLPISPVRREIIERWFEMSREEKELTKLPTSMKEMARYVGIGTSKFRDIKRTHLKAKFNTALSKIDPTSIIEDEPKHYNSDAWLRGRTLQADTALLKACESGNAQALRTYYQLTQRLIEKQEVTHRLDGSIIAREILRARRELEVEGVVKVSDESPALSNQFLLSTGQEQSQNSQV